MFALLVSSVQVRMGVFRLGGAGILVSLHWLFPLQLAALALPYLGLLDLLQSWL